MVMTVPSEGEARVAPNTCDLMFCVRCAAGLSIPWAIFWCVASTTLASDCRIGREGCEEADEVEVG